MVRLWSIDNWHWALAPNDCKVGDTFVWAIRGWRIVEQNGKRRIKQISLTEALGKKVVSYSEDHNLHVLTFRWYLRMLGKSYEF